MKISLVSLAIIWLAVTGCGGQTAAPSTAQVSPPQEVTAESSEEEKETAQQPEAGTAGENTAASKSVSGEESKAVEEETAAVEMSPSHWNEDLLKAMSAALDGLPMEREPVSVKRNSVKAFENGTVRLRGSLEKYFSPIGD